MYGTSKKESGNLSENRSIYQSLPGRERHGSDERGTLQRPWDLTGHGIQIPDADAEGWRDQLQRPQNDQDPENDEDEG